MSDVLANIKETMALRFSLLMRKYHKIYGDSDPDRVLNRLMDNAANRSDLPADGRVKP